MSEQTASGESGQYQKATTDSVTGLETQGYFIDNVTSCIEKNKRAQDPTLHVGLVAMRLHEEPENLLNSFMSEAGAAVGQFSDQYEHATFYKNAIVLALRISTETDNMALARTLEDTLGQHARDYQLEYDMASVLTNNPDQLETTLEKITKYQA